MVELMEVTNKMNIITLHHEKVAKKISYGGEIFIMSFITELFEML